jgi:hypothetical protein
MKSISIHGIDKETEKAIKERAKSQGASVNKVVKDLISKSLGLSHEGKGQDNREEFVDLCGIWTDDEASRFLESIGDLEAVDPRDWT